MHPRTDFVIPRHRGVYLTQPAQRFIVVLVLVIVFCLAQRRQAAKTYQPATKNEKLHHESHGAAFGRSQIFPLARSLHSLEIAENAEKRKAIIKALFKNLCDLRALCERPFNLLPDMKIRIQWKTITQKKQQVDLL